MTSGSLTLASSNFTLFRYPGSSLTHTQERVMYCFPFQAVLYQTFHPEGFYESRGQWGWFLLSLLYLYWEVYAAHTEDCIFLHSPHETKPDNNRWQQNFHFSQLVVIAKQFSSQEIIIVDSFFWWQEKYRPIRNKSNNTMYIHLAVPEKEKRPWNRCTPDSNVENSWDISFVVSYCHKFISCGLHEQLKYGRTLPLLNKKALRLVSEESMNIFHFPGLWVMSSDCIWSLITLWYTKSLSIMKSGARSLRRSQKWKIRHH